MSQMRAERAYRQSLPRKELRRRSKTAKTSYRGQNRTNCVQADQDSDSTDDGLDDSLVCQINGDSSQTMKVQLQINGTPLSMEIDTGAAVSIISEPTQRNLFPTATLQPARIKLRTYTLGILCPCLAMEKLLWMSHINRTTTRFH